MRLPYTSSVFLAALMVLPSSAIADPTGTGGAAVPDPPAVAEVSCVDGTAWSCKTGRMLTIKGESLDRVKAVTFLGGRGGRDDRETVPHNAGASELSVTVPEGAKTGPIKVSAPGAGTTRTARKVKISVAPPVTFPGKGAKLSLPADVVVAGGQKRATLTHSGGGVADAVRLSDGVVVRSWKLNGTAGELTWDGTVDGVPAPAGRYALRLRGSATARASQAEDGLEFTLIDAVFPIRGAHDLGQSATNNFGGARNHKGQDLFAKCGTPLVAAQSGKVQFTAFHGRAGWYAVIQRADGVSHAYMHMRMRPTVKKGQRVFAGQLIGEVGDTGRASGCHLHFEQWTAPGWYTGGHAVDPLPELTRWDAQS